eukprot:TRINITY_DN6131_c0_g1_i8.p1 TRINITY_DN6131_c0_g1~~TRINITY_DN6131_c0_g1_i8.p1  ORF type:complete len:326 (-),score=82.08 TRINITY_DN6131_c0_g1_i8:470-1447(-)
MKAKVIEKRKEAPLMSKHRFWSTQPVMQFDDLDRKDLPTGPIKKIDPKDVPLHPYPLPEGLEWTEIDVNTKDLDDVYVLLRENYIEEAVDFRMKFTPEYLKWVFSPPGHHKEWCIGVRNKDTKELIAFNNGSPSRASVDGKVLDMMDYSFACVSKKYRSKRLTPLLIQEIIRRINLKGVWQYYFSTDKVLFAPFSENWFYRRDFDIKLGLEIGVSAMPEGCSTVEEALEYAKVPESANLPGLRPMVKEDVPQVHALFSEYLKKFRLYPIFTEEAVAHWLLPRKDIVYTYVIADADNKATDFVSFYVVPYTVMNHPQVTECLVTLL